jgi:hypothetical protein
MISREIRSRMSRFDDKYPAVPLCSGSTLYRMRTVNPGGQIMHGSGLAFLSRITA